MRILLIIILLLVLGFGFFKQIENREESKSVVSPTQEKTIQKQAGADIETVVQDLDIPWEVAFLPGDEILLTERPGRLLKIGQDRKVIQVSGVAHVGEGGLLGLVLHPDFKTNSLIYLYLTAEDGDKLVNRVERYKLQDNSLSDRKVIIAGILGSSNHDGGRLEFGPDGYLYATTGDAEQPNLAQNTNSLNGKILRVKDDGSIPMDNPFGNAIYSYGHRNVQGLAWDQQGRLWATEHGRSGFQSGYDELNLIEKGKNYGWPEIQGDEQQQGMTTPVIHSGPNETWAPSGAAFIEGSIFFAGLRGETLYQAEIANGKVVSLKKHLQSEYGRLRAVRLGPDGFLYITTSNRDGRGDPKLNDDKLLRINPKIFK